MENDERCNKVRCLQTLCTEICGRFNRAEASGTINKLHKRCLNNLKDHKLITRKGKGPYTITDEGKDVLHQIRELPKVELDIYDLRANKHAHLLPFISRIRRITSNRVCP